MDHFHQFLVLGRDPTHSQSRKPEHLGHAAGGNAFFV